jgi:hypothetical protein
MPSYAPRGPAPKPQRRRRNVPASYGAAAPTTAPAAPDVGRELGLNDPHPLVVDLWEAVQESCESRFYSQADWVRLRWECWHASAVMLDGARPASAWAAVQHGLTELLVSLAAKRRAGIELRPRGVDVDADAAVSMTARYRQSLKPV